MTTRVKIADDPLSGLLSSPSDEPKQRSMPETSSVVRAEASKERDVDFKGIDTNKIKFTDKKVKQEQPKAEPIVESYNEVVPVPNATATHSGLDVSSGLGYNVDLWTNHAKTSPKAEVDSLFDGLALPRSGDDGMFTRDVSSSKKEKSTLQPVTSTSNIRLASVDDDDNISSLKVSKLLQRETDLSFDVYGKAKLPEAPLFSSEDLDISSLDRISSLEKDIESSNISGSKKGKAKTAGATDAVFGNANIDLNALNLDDYIAQNSNSSASLFD